MSATTATATYVADIDQAEHPMERPFLRLFVIADSDEQARERAADCCGEGEAVRGVQTLQSIIDPIAAAVRAGRRWRLDFKHESGTEGPVWLTDLDHPDLLALAAEQAVVGVEFGTEPPWSVALPWMSRQQARKMAAYIGVPYGES